MHGQAYRSCHEEDTETFLALGGDYFVPSHSGEEASKKVVGHGRGDNTPPRFGGTRLENRHAVHNHR